MVPTFSVSKLKVPVGIITWTLLRSPSPRFNSLLCQSFSQELCQRKARRMTRMFTSAQSTRQRTEWPPMSSRLKWRLPSTHQPNGSLPVSRLSSTLRVFPTSTHQRRRFLFPERDNFVYWVNEGLDSAWVIIQAGSGPSLLDSVWNCS